MLTVKLLLVEDVLVALQQLARYNRLQFKIPVIGLTGTNGKTTTNTAALAVTPEVMQPADKGADLREKERNACMSNNIGVGNTFVWASRYSNANDYSTMIEDVNFPENNTCFVKVELKSNDERIQNLIFVF